MKGKINFRGNLEIERAGQGFISMLCPWDTRATKDIPVECGDHCPFFGEPGPLTQMVIKKSSVATPAQQFGGRELPPGMIAEPKEGYGIVLCRQQLFFEQFTDERI